MAIKKINMKDYKIIGGTGDVQAGMTEEEKAQMNELIEAINKLAETNLKDEVNADE